MTDKTKNTELSTEELKAVNSGILPKARCNPSGLQYLENLARKHENVIDFVKTVGDRVKQVSRLTDEELKQLYEMVHGSSE